MLPPLNRIRSLTRKVVFSSHKFLWENHGITETGQTPNRVVSGSAFVRETFGKQVLLGTAIRESHLV